MQFDWPRDEKDTWLRQHRGFGFADVVAAVQAGGLLDIRTHHNPNRYPNQRILVVKIDEYVYLVPCVVDGDQYFLKTIYASRKATRDYLTQEDV